MKRAIDRFSPSMSCLEVIGDGIECECAQISDSVTTNEERAKSSKVAPPTGDGISRFHMNDASAVVDYTEFTK